MIKTYLKIKSLEKISLNNKSKLHQYVRLAKSPSVIKRGIKYSLIVGTVLTCTNHGDRLLEGEVTGIRMLKIGLTYTVPYVVSSLSSIQALLNK